MVERVSEARVTRYVSIGAERNSRSVNIDVKGSVTLESDINDPLAERGMVDEVARVIALAHLGGYVMEQLMSDAPSEEAINLLKEAVQKTLNDLLA